MPLSSRQRLERPIALQGKPGARMCNRLPVRTHGNGCHVCAPLVVSAHASGATAPHPASTRRTPHTVMDQRESTMSSTRKTGSGTTASGTARNDSSALRVGGSCSPSSSVARHCESSWGKGSV
jgi:hypothetical protein